MVYLHNETSRTSLYDRVKKLLVSYEWSDCCFSVSGKEFKAHKLILCISSPVFEAMFYGPLSSSDCIVVPDIEPDIFQQLLNFIYTDKVELRSIEEALELLYAAKKYLLNELTDMCITYVKDHISIDNIITILNYPEYLQDDDVIPTARTLFCQHAEYLLQENKTEMSPHCLKSVLESNALNVKEKDLIKHIFAWTALYCKQNDMPITLKARRDVLIKNDIFKSLRFLSMSLEELDEVVLDENNILVPSEIDRLKEAIKGTKVLKEEDEIGTLGSVYSDRYILKLQWKLCHRKPLKSVAPISIDANNFTICCKVKANKSVFITSLCIPTRMAPVFNFRNNTAKVYSEQISVSVISESDNKVIKFTNYMNTVEYDSMINIELSEPCVIKKDKWYKIEFAWHHNRCLSYPYAVQCRDRYFKDYRLLFEFEDLSLNSGNCGLGSYLAGLKYCL
ncbi:kelch-like protein 40 [Hyposmocoma kahamanoa]|uniref:kelch-like protein 40 n=1 Tax=Hyposmocoma kahamanoa TaxID=1477025 RepID=UPI000E6D6932|nr:kelch-like protein 40 [Hyposmocoma kahamanoa]